MDKKDFIDELKKNLETEEDITEDTILKNLCAYDSLANLVVIAFIDSRFKKKISSRQLQSITTIRSLMELVGMENFEGD